MDTPELDNDIQNSKSRCYVKNVKKYHVYLSVYTNVNRPFLVLWLFTALMASGIKHNLLFVLLADDLKHIPDDISLKGFREDPVCDNLICLFVQY